jgi:hypothetical protein
VSTKTYISDSRVRNGEIFSVTDGVIHEWTSYKFETKFEARPDELTHQAMLRAQAETERIMTLPDYDEPVDLSLCNR